MKHLFKFTLSLFLFVFTSISASAWNPWFELSLDGINYRLYYTGSFDNVEALNASAFITEGFSGYADIASSVSYEYTYSAGVDEFGNTIYKTKTLTAPVTEMYSTFKNCPGLTGVNIPNTVTWIGGFTFEGCTGLTSVTIPNSVTYIDSFAFQGCTGLTSISIPNSVTGMGQSVFWGCTGLKHVNISNSIQRIRHYTFCDCSSLTEVVIPNSVTTIENYVFSGCSSLENITIGSSVTSIGDRTFVYHYSNPPSSIITCLAEVPPETGVWSFAHYNATLRVPAGSLYEYQTARTWKEFYRIEAIPEDYSISLNETNVVIEKGDFIQLRATVTPDDGFAPEVTWSSSNSSIATVDEWGTVTAVGSGDAVITARAGDASATCRVKVVEHIVTLDKSSVSLPQYSTVQLHATVTPDDEYAPGVTWSSSRPGVATVTQDGLVKGYMAGTATITARAGQSVATCEVTITPVLATSLVLNSYQENLEVSNIFRLVATIYPDYVSDWDVEWIIPENDVISWNWNGNECVILAEKVGSVLVTARTTDGTNLSASCQINVVEPVVYATSITLSESNIVLREGHFHQLYATVLPTYAVNKSVSWRSSDTGVATVTTDGLVFGINPGRATISAWVTDDPVLNVKCKVTVLGSGDPVDILPGDVNDDGRVTIDDVVALIDYLLSGKTDGINLNNADVDRDGYVKIDDVVTLIDLLLTGGY